MGVKDIVDSINIELKYQLEKNGIGSIKAFGLSENVVSKNQQFPVFFKKNDGTWAGFDDKKNVILYHKLNNVSSSETPEGKYGNSYGGVSNKYSMTLVIFFKNDILKLRRDELFTFVQAVMPEQLSGEKFSYIRTSISGAVLNTTQVFQQEYKGIAYSLKPEQSLIAISYQIEGRFKKGCFNCCSEE